MKDMHHLVKVRYPHIYTCFVSRRSTEAKTSKTQPGDTVWETVQIDLEMVSKFSHLHGFSLKRTVEKDGGTDSSGFPVVVGGS